MAEEGISIQKQPVFPGKYINSWPSVTHCKEESHTQLPS